MPETKLYHIEDATASDVAAPLTSTDVQLAVKEQLRNLNVPLVMQTNDMRSGNFVTGSSGWQLTAAGNLEANAGTFRGALVANSLDIPDTTTANSFHVDNTGNAWWGATTLGSAIASVTKAGLGTFSNIAITGGTASALSISGIPNNSSTDISLLEKTWTMVFSVTDADTVAWTSGTVTLSNGRTFSISSGNTGNMAALTYIYIDPAISSTVLQTTTTAATALGANKCLVGTAVNNTVTASFIPYGPGQPLIDGSNIGALSIVAGNIAASTITSGKISVSQLSAIAADMGTLTTGVINMSSGTSNIHSGQTAYNTGTGFWLERNGGTPRFSIGDSSANILTWDGTTLTVKGTINVSAINLPDTTTANSAHIDSSGNTWWGANVANGLANANASVTSAGAAVFKSIQVGGSSIQYTLNDNGVYNYGDGSNGAATFSDQGTAPTGTTKTDNTAGATVFRLDRDVYYTTMTVNATVTVLTNQYRVFCNTSATVNGTISGNGGAGHDAALSVGGSGGSLNTNYLAGAPVGGTGGSGNGAGNNGANGGNGTNNANCLSSNNGAAAGGGGNSGGAAIGGSAGTAGTTTATTIKLIANWHLATLLDIAADGATKKFQGSASAAGGGAGGSSAGTSGGGGGGGSNGGVLAMYAKSLTIGAAGVISSNGGKGGNGAAGVSGNSGGGGGGGGGNGGIVVLVYNTLSNSGSVTASLGAQGTKGAGAGSGAAGVDGTAGLAGLIYQFQVSL